MQTLIQNESVFFVDSSSSSNSSKFSELFEVVDNDDEKWISQKVNYFDFFYDNKTTIIDEFMKHVDKNIYFRDVHMFVDRIKNVIVIKSDKLVKNNLYICFKNRAFYWWNFVLTSKQKRLVKLKKDVDEWVQVLLKRFKKTTFLIMTTIIITRYIMKDARRKREFIKYALIIIKTIKTIDMSIFNQITLIYNEIELKFRRDLSKSSKSFIMNSCLQKLKKIKKLWWNMIFVKQRSINYSSFDFQTNRNVENNRSISQSDSYANFNSDERQNDYEYNNSIAIYEEIEYSNQSSRSTQYFSSYQFQNRVYQSQ